jgi:hypothetical protein
VYISAGFNEKMMKVEEKKFVAAGITVYFYPRYRKPQNFNQINYDSMLKGAIKHEGSHQYSTSSIRYKPLYYN